MTESRKKAGFTLIEILTSMVILSMIILMMARLFTESTRAFELGTSLADQNLKGRMVLDFMAREISQAVADDVLAFRLDSEDIDLFGNAVEDGDRLQFVTLSNIMESGERQVREVIYWVEEMRELQEDGSYQTLAGRYRLRRSLKNNQTSLTCYEDPPPHKWWNEGGFTGFNANDVAENIAGFQVWCYPGPGASSIYNYDSSNTQTNQMNKLPMWIEVALMMFDEKDAIHAANMYEFGMSDEEVRTFAIKHARRYVTRINFVNRNGYAEDK